jgi:type IV secretory pathway VirD2 relaxase
MNIDGSRAKLYGTDIEEYRQNMTDRNFRIFLSTQSDKINLKDMTEKFVKKLEQQTGYAFYWQGANHYNTAHSHAHLLINENDKNGRKVEIPRDIVKTFMREYARDICTSQIGYRTAYEIAVEKEGETVSIKTYESQRGRLTPVIFKQKAMNLIDRQAY